MQPAGPKTLCNACGVKWLRHVKRQRDASAPTRVHGTRQNHRSVGGDKYHGHNSTESSEEMNYTTETSLAPDADEEAAALNLLTFATSTEVRSSSAHQHQSSSQHAPNHDATREIKGTAAPKTTASKTTQVATPTSKSGPASGSGAAVSAATTVPAEAVHQPQVYCWNHFAAWVPVK